MALFQELGQLLSNGGALGAASSALGSNETNTRSALTAAVPMLLGSMGKRANTSEGASAIFDLVQKNDGSILNDQRAAFTGSDDGGVGEALVGGLLGGGRDRVTQGLARHSGLDLSQIAKLLPMVAPLVMGFLGKKQTDGNLDQAALAGTLANERVAMESAGFGSLLGLLDGGDEEADERGFLGAFSGLAAGGLAAGGLAAGGTAAASKLTGGVSKAASTVTGATVTGATTRATPVAAHTEERKGGLAKVLIPLLLIGLLGFGIWAFLQGRDGDDTAATAADTTTTQLEEMAEEAEAVASEPEEEPAEEVAMADADGFIDGNILDAGDKSGEVGGFLSAVTATGLNAELDGDGPFTIFAPSDEALASLPESVISDPAQLERVLRNHVVEGDFPADALVDGPLTSLDGSALNVALGSGSPVINGANVTTAGLGGANGTMHVIDQVLLPADLIASTGGSLNEALGIQPINFEVGSAVITADSTAVLDGAAEFLLANGTVVEIAGHTDADGDDASNLALSQARAEAVMAYLADKGVPAENMTAVGYGETQPVASNDTPEGKAENRRIEFVATAS